MRDYGPAHGLDPVNWTFLTSGPDRLMATRELVERFGHKFTEVDGGYQVHGVVTNVIDREGRWRANFHGLRFDPTNLILHLNALVNDHHDASAGESALASQASGANLLLTRGWLAVLIAALGLGIAVGAFPLYRTLRN